MAKGKEKSVFFCQECGYESAKWLGKCPGCGQWNTFVEELVTKQSGDAARLMPSSEPMTLQEIYYDDVLRIDTGIHELNRVLGGGMVPGALMLLAGDPGIGKSTLTMQLTGSIHMQEKILYVSGEESRQQLKMRAQRLGIGTEQLYILTENNLSVIEKHIDKIKPGLLILDSIQTVYLPEITSAPGSVSQLRECTGKLLQWAKGLGLSVIVVWHVTKDGAVAGPRVLEHMVDTVLFFEGERHNHFRILRALKNRFGSTNEIGVFEMQEQGLREVHNPSEVFLSERPQDTVGSVVVPCMEGTRPVLVELQALVASSPYGQPRRMTNGADYNRTAMLLAVLEKKMRLPIGNHDIFLNVVGGLKVDEPAIDLGIIAALVSSMQNRPILKDAVVLGEVGLTGEVRTINFLDKRLIEAEKMGFRVAVVPAGNLKQGQKFPIEVKGVRNVGEALRVLLGGA
ncbi:MAG: DNA repair protein RadA [Peptococcaceae bacterium]|nr:DNA repair protein RadA [Peptococcaceae bacterium]